MIKYVTVKEFSEFSKFLTKNFEKGRKLPTYCKQTKIYDWRYFMNYDFTNTQDYIKFLSNLREGVVGNQATIYFDDKNNVIKIFSLEDTNFDSRKKEAKLKELMKIKNRFPTAALPEEIIKCQGKCVGYIMPLLTDCKSISKFQFETKRQQSDLKNTLEVACELAKFIKDLHSEGIVFGDLHPGQFMTKNGKIYVCDTDTWGFANEGKYYEADKGGRPEYIDPKVRDFNQSGVSITGYTKESDYFSLAIIVFEMLVGAGPFDGKYPLVKKYDRALRALNHISILGNHDLNDPNTFMMKHVAWMSEGLQTDFLQIFEGNKRFNILPSLENQAKDLKKCVKYQYYNSSIYSECPCCRSYQDSEALMEFRNYNVDPISYDRNGIFAKEKVRKIMNFSTFLDYDNNAIHLKENGQSEQVTVTSKTDKVCFTERGFVVKVNRISKVKQFFNTLLGKFNTLYDNCSFSEKMKRCQDTNDPACELEVLRPDGKRLYSTLILKSSSKLMIVGDHIFYLKNKKDLVDIYMTENDCLENVVTTITDPFIYEINELGEYCMCSIDNEGQLNIIVNEKKIIQLINEIPKVVKYDDISESWCIITKATTGDYNVYVIGKNNEAEQKFDFFSFGGLNLKNCIFNNSMLVIPANKRIIFLKSGPTVAKSMVTEKQIGIVNPNSKITIRYNSFDECTYLYVQNSNQVYKINLS